MVIFKCHGCPKKYPQKWREKENCCWLINFSSKHWASLCSFKTSKQLKKRLKVCKTIPINKILLVLRKLIRPPAKNVTPWFLLDETLHLSTFPYYFSHFFFFYFVYFITCNKHVIFLLCFCILCSFDLCSFDPHP